LFRSLHELESAKNEEIVCIITQITLTADITYSKFDVNGMAKIYHKNAGWPKK